MSNFLKAIVSILVLAIVVVAGLFVFNVVSVEETKDLLVKVSMLIGVFAIGGFAIWLLSGRGECKKE